MPRGSVEPRFRISISFLGIVAHEVLKSFPPSLFFEDFIYLPEAQREREHKQGEWEREKQASY